MFTYSGKFRASGAHNEMPADDLETAKLHIEDVASLALLDFVGQLLVERVEVTLLESAAAHEYTVDILLHSPDHSTLLHRKKLASARRHIDSTLSSLLTELFGRMRVVHTALTYADCDAAWGEVPSIVPVAASLSATFGE